MLADKGLPTAYYTLGPFSTQRLSRVALTGVVRMSLSTPSTDQLHRASQDVSMLEDTEGRAYKTRRTSVTSPEHRHKESSTSPALSASTSPGSRGSSSSRGPRVPQLDIVNFPSTELLRMLAVLLQHIVLHWSKCVPSFVRGSRSAQCLFHFPRFFVVSCQSNAWS